MENLKDHSARSTSNPACRWLIAALAALSISMYAHSDQAASPEPEPEPDDHAARGTLAAFYWVGSGSDCHFDNIPDAISASGGDRDPYTLITIRVAGSNYDFQRLWINFNNFFNSETWHLEELRIVGGYSSCGASAPGGSRTTLNANGQCCENLHRVVTILGDDDPERPRTVRLENLSLTGGFAGMTASGEPWHGGGISISGQPGRLSVQLRNSLVFDNEAEFGSGGGIYVEATAAEDVDDPANTKPLLALDDDTTVRDNSADTYGGGIRCVNEHDAGAEIFYTSHLQIGNALIRGNSAEHGGGISVAGCRAVIRAGGPYFYNFMTDSMIHSGGIIENWARNRGGGIHATTGARVNLLGASNAEWGGDPDSAAWVYLNSAVRGGGLYAWGENTEIRARDAWFELNEARPSGGSEGFGGGIYIGGSADFFMDRWLWTDGVQYRGCRMSREPLAGTPPRCSGIIGNHAAGRGGAVFVINRATAWINNSYILNNSSDQLNGAISHARNPSSQTGSPYATVRFQNALIAGNSGPNRGMYSGPGGLHDIRYSTIAGNELSASNASVIRGFSNDDERPGIFSIIGSIVHDDNARPLTSSGDFGGAALVRCVMANGNIDDLNYEDGAVGYFSEVADPEFIDPDNGDYRLAQTSPAINYCDDSSFFLVPPIEHDLDLRDRDQVFPGEINDPPNPAPGRIYDLGAYVVTMDRLFRDRFESE